MAFEIRTCQIISDIFADTGEMTIERAEIRRRWLAIAPEHAEPRRKPSGTSAGAKVNHYVNSSLLSLEHWGVIKRTIPGVVEIINLQELNEIAEDELI